MNKIRDTQRIDALFEKVVELIEQARHRVVSTVNLAEVYTKYRIGQYIVEDEQKGRNRAQYGQQVLKNLSGRLTERFGSGWSLETLKNCRFFYSVYCNRKIGSTVFTQLPETKKVDSVYPSPRPNTHLQNQKECFCGIDSAQRRQYLRSRLRALSAGQVPVTAETQSVDRRI